MTDPPEPAVLVLFDIDATLLTTLRAGVLAMGDAGRRLFGGSFDESRVEYAGRLDPLIIADLLAAHGRDAGPAGVEAFRAAYADALADRLAEPGRARALPGVTDLLDALDDAAGVTLGLLTGNYPETGSMKLRAAGLDPDRFAVRVWGCDSPHDPPARDHLPAVALERVVSVTGSAIDADRAVIVGDTVHDVACARACGCRSLATATGVYSAQALADAGADLAVDDLTDTEGLTRWMLTPTPTAPPI
ncbi:MAG: hypothetical protein D6693_06480 [Planctomycetota bacterium]|nr:MAG: hypothetical protein D6693_06480 [Planctomycetota bacterium]